MFFTPRKDERMTPTQTETDRAQAIEDVYRQLVKGLGREHVNDGNVFALIKRAEQDGHTVLAEELREWQAPC
jgi:hypothetical protein